MNEIRLISLWQPWASLIAAGLKQYETRSWGTAYRGKVAIQAAKRPVNRDEVLPILYATGGGGVSVEDFDHLNQVVEQDLPLGAIVAIVDLSDCQKMVSAKTTLTEFYKQPESVQKTQIPIISLLGATALEQAVGDWQPGRYAWRLENIRPIAQPIPCKGAQGLRMIREAALLRAIEEQMVLTDSIEQQLQAIDQQGGAS